MTKQVKADLMLVLVTLCWGVSYYLMDLSLTDIGPLTLNGLRFLIAFLIASVLLFPKLRSINRATLKYSALIAVSLVFAYIGVSYGVMYTSLSNSGFLIALSVVFTPLLARAVFKTRIERKVMVSVVLSVIGIGLLTLSESLKPALGDILCIMCAIAYAADLVLTEKAVSRDDVDALQVGVLQLGFTGAFNLILALFVEDFHFPTTAPTWGAVLFLAIFCTGLAFIVQAVAQQYTSASHVGVIFTLEPVFAGIAAFFLAGEVLAPRAYIGAVILLAALFLMELDLSKLAGKWSQKKKEPEREAP